MFFPTKTKVEGRIVWLEFYWNKLAQGVDPLRKVLKIGWNLIILENIIRVRYKIAQLSLEFRLKIILMPWTQVSNLGSWTRNPIIKEPIIQKSHLNYSERRILKVHD